MYTRGSIISVPFPFTDLTSSKPRPALVISNDEWLKNTGDVIVVMITAKHHKDGINIPIEKDDLDFELPKESYVRCHRIATIDHKIIINKIGEVKPQLMERVRSAVAVIMSPDSPSENAVVEFIE